MSGKLTDEAEQARRRECWKRAQQARRDRLAGNGSFEFRAWVTPGDAEWLAQVLLQRREQAAGERRRERLRQLLGRSGQVVPR